MPVNLSFEKGFGDFKKFVEVRFDVVHCVFVCFVTYLNKITTSFISTTYQQMLIAQHVNLKEKLNEKSLSKVASSSVDNCLYVRNRPPCGGYSLSKSYIPTRHVRTGM